MLEKDGEDQLDRSCEKCRSISKSRGGEEYPTDKKEGRKKERKANWIGHMMHRNCLLKHIIERKVEGRIERTVRQGRIRKQLLVDL